MNVFRVSEVDAFRQWRDDEEAELDSLLAKLTGRSTASEAMLAGIAFHKALELAGQREHDSLEALGYTFNMRADIELTLAPIREIRASKTYTVDDQPITISGQLDALDGRRIEDHKTTSRFDPERYLAGYQWRLYLDIFGADTFRWNVFEIACNEDVLPPGMVWDVHAFHRLEQHRYPEMGADCQRLVADFARFVREHVPQRCGAPVAA